MKYEAESRPWGMYEVLLDSDTTKVKRITVAPGGKLSYQYHKFSCLLYTSPSPRDKRQSRMPSSA